MGRALRELGLSLLMAAVLFLGVNSASARSYVEGPSMEPNLHTGQVLLVSRLGISGLTRQVYGAAHREEPSPGGGWVPPRGAITIFAPPTDNSRMLVKRVIGLPGEEIAIYDGVVYIDGRPLDEPYVTNRDTRSMSPRRVPLDSVFVMGDNRPVSGDSRAFGPVSRSSLVGIAVLRYWPLTDIRLLVGR